MEVIIWQAALSLMLYPWSHLDETVYMSYDQIHTTYLFY